MLAVLAVCWLCVAVLAVCWLCVAVLAVCWLCVAVLAVLAVWCVSLAVNMKKRLTLVLCWVVVVFSGEFGPRLTRNTLRRQNEYLHRLYTILGRTHTDR